MAITLMVIIFSLALWLGFLVWTQGRRQRVRERAFHAALESNQKLVDRQTAQVNIFVKALPNIHALVGEGGSDSMWKSTTLDEVRAMLRADGASYWKYSERDQILTRDVVRGTEMDPQNKVTRVGLQDGQMGEVIKMRQTLAIDQMDHLAGNPAAILVPLVVGEHLWGVYRLTRSHTEKITSREAELVTVFINQVAVFLQNKEMVSNHDKFYLELVQTLADTLDTRDASREGQTRRARQLARGIAKELDMPDEFIYYLEFAALMHDIGNLAIDDNLLKKPGKLTPEEFAIIKKHPELGYKILSPVSMLAPVAPMVLYHQEWYNGKGYPEGLKGEEIPLGARIVAILDAWGAMTCDRPWRKALSPSQAAKEIKKGAGTQFDPRVVDAFLRAIEKQGISTESLK
jgi:HD-GYP domain-containing protein (c-di-GMP phosphodiesterase class II)